jgi:SAM-dependent methyltransferase
MTPKCTICETESPFLLKKDGYDLYRCPTCALVFVYPQPKDDFLKDKVYSYESGYQSNKKGIYTDKPKDKKTEQTFYTLEDLGVEGTLLDVGCSNGEFMHYAQLQGFTAYGVELNRRTAEIAKENGFNVYNGYLKDAGYADEFFDVVYLGDVIEHVTNPHDLIKECSRILKKGGVMVISTPNLDCPWPKSTFWLYKLFKIPWSSVTPPYHLHQFSFGNLYRLMRCYHFSLVDQFFLRPPRLAYELGSLHLLKRVKQTKLPFTFFYMIFAYVLYAAFYLWDILITPFKTKDFAMVVTYKKE